MRIRDLILSRGGTALLMAALLTDTILVFTQVFLYQKIPLRAAPGVLHMVLGAILVGLVAEIQGDGKIWRATSEYTQDLWKTSIAIATAVGIITTFALTVQMPVEWYYKVIAGAVVGVYSFLPIVAGAFAIRIVYHRN